MNFGSKTVGQFPITRLTSLRRSCLCLVLLWFYTPFAGHPDSRRRMR